MILSSLRSELMANQDEFFLLFAKEIRVIANQVISLGR